MRPESRRPTAIEAIRYYSNMMAQPAETCLFREAATHAPIDKGVAGGKIVIAFSDQGG